MLYEFYKFIVNKIADLLTPEVQTKFPENRITDYILSSTRKDMITVSYLYGLNVVNYPKEIKDTDIFLYI